MRLLIAIAATVGFNSACLAGPDQVLEIEGDRVRSAYVTSDEWSSHDLAELPRSDMLRRAHGLIAELRPNHVARLRRAVAEETRVLERPSGTKTVCILHLVGELRTKRVEVGRVPSGWLLASELGTESPRFARLVESTFREVAEGWEPYTGSISTGPSNELIGVPVDLVQPYLAHAVEFDRKVMRARFGPTATDVQPVGRDLEDERFVCRLPKAYHPSLPAGVLVWIDPTPAARIPQALHAGLDELGMICVSAGDAGNDRAIMDRLQLALDAVETIRRRFHVDDSRVYVSGMSGGGRSSSMLWGTCPDIFAGAIPVVGLNSYMRAPRSDGLVFPSSFVKPRGRRLAQLKLRRLGSITGPDDFNFEEMRVRTEQLDRDGMAVRMFSYDGLGHEMPDQEQFAEALRWVDEPWRLQRSRDVSDADRAMQRYVARHGDGPPEDAQAEAMLLRVIEEAPWSGPAWDAAALLGMPRPEDGGG